MPITKDATISKTNRPGSGLSLSVLDLQAIRKLLETETGGAYCPSCQMPFDKGKKRKLIDNCGHERCYSCMFKNEQCPVCRDAIQDADNENDNDDDVDNGNKETYSYNQKKLQEYCGGSSTAITTTTTTTTTLADRGETFGSQHFMYLQQQQQQQRNHHLQQQQHQHQQHLLPHGKLTSSTVAGTKPNHSYGNYLDYRPNSTSPEWPNDQHANLMASRSKSSNVYTTPADIIVHQQNCTATTGASAASAAAAATPPQNRRRLFNAKNFRSPFGQRRTTKNPTNTNPTACSYSENNSTLSALDTSSHSDSFVTTRRCFLRTKRTVNDAAKLQNRRSLGSITAALNSVGWSSGVLGKLKSMWNINGTTSGDYGLTLLPPAPDDEGGNVKPISFTDNKSKIADSELHLRLGYFLQSHTRRNVRNTPAQSCSSLTSVNTSPVSTLTGSSEADVSTVLRESNGYNRIGCDSIGSLMSVSISGQSNGSASPVSRRHSVTTAQSGPVEELGLFKAGRKSFIRRSARMAHIRETGPDSKHRLAAHRPQPPYLTLKPLFFEVPLQEPDPLFFGRNWLLKEISNTITNTESRGILISGAPGTGKTAFILQLVEHSCFGRRRDLTTQVPPSGSPAPTPTPPLPPSSSASSTTSSSSASCRQFGTIDSDNPLCKPYPSPERIKALSTYVVGYHFCQADNNATCTVADFIHSLAAQLCQAPQLSHYREYIQSEPHLQNILSVKECIADPERAMKMGILEPLTLLRRNGKILQKNCIILVDALCEAEYHRPDHGDTIASFLTRMIEYFPAWLRIVATIRTQMIEFVKGLSFTRMTLDSWTSNENVQKDILDYITFRVANSTIIQKNLTASKDANQMKFAQYLLGLSKGSFLFVKLIMDLIEQSHLVIKSASYKVLPVSLAQIFQLQFNLRFQTCAAYDKISTIVNVCLAALYPQTLAEIFEAVNGIVTSDPIDWNTFLTRFAQLSGFLIKRLDNTYMFFHPSFREWLIRRDDGESNKFLCDLRAGHAGILFKLARFYSPLTAELTLEMGHHILKAHIYRNAPQEHSPRDLQSYWIAASSACVSSALCTLRNVYSPNLKVSRLLLLSGASPNFCTDFLGNAPILCIAAHEGNVPMVKLLLEFGADVELANSQGCTPLILAASRGHCDVVRQLVAAGSSLGHTDTSNRCALVHAARMGKSTIVKYLMACDWIARLHSTDVGLMEASQQALVAAATQGHTSIIEDLLDMDHLEVDEPDPMTGETALTASAKSGCCDSTAMLLCRGARVDAPNKKLMTALHLAVKEGHWAVTERLLQNRSDIEQRDPATGKTAIIIAAEEGHVGIIELLCNHDASLAAVDCEGLSALSWACLRGRLQAAKCLIEKNADIQHVDNTGRSPLDLAAYQGSASLVQMLLDKGVKIEHVDINGMRPLDRAIACRNIQVVQVFLKRGAKLGPATWAMAAGKSEIMLLLLNKLLEDGNILYKKNRLQEAAHRYQYALRKIPPNSTEYAETFLQLKFNFLLNHSRCKRKMNEVADSIDLANQAVEIRPENYEGYYARAKAFMDMNSVDKAYQDCEMALEFAKNGSTDIKTVLLHLKEELIIRSASSLTNGLNNINNNNNNSRIKNSQLDLMDTVTDL